MKDGGQLPTQKQIMYGWKVSPVARNIALILRDFAIEQEHPKVTIAVNKLSQITDAGEKAVNSGLDELQDKGFVESDRPKHNWVLCILQMLRYHPTDPYGRRIYVDRY